jgi:hypothetical protein
LRAIRRPPGGSGQSAVQIVPTAARCARSGWSRAAARRGPPGSPAGHELHGGMVIVNHLMAAHLQSQPAQAQADRLPSRLGARARMPGGQDVLPRPST